MKKQANQSYKKIARNLTCQQCDKNFIFTSYDQPYHNSVPNLCPMCRRKIAEGKRRQQEEQENAEWDGLKKEQHKLFEEQLQQYHVVSLDKIMPCNDKDILYILGNGFDMMHGVKSSYYSFRDSIGKRNQLRMILETFLLPDDIWADFESALGQFNVAMMNSADIIDTNLDMRGAYDEDAGAAEYYLAVEMAANPIVTVAQELQQYFRICEVVNHLDNLDNVNWYIGCHGLRDLENMQNMIQKLNISQEKVSIFRTDLISVNFDLLKSQDREKSIMKKEKIRGISPKKTWRATSVEGILRVYSQQDKEPVFESRFSKPISKVVFSYDEKYMFIIIRGVYSGIFIFAYEENVWHFVNELENIPHQSLLNRRLRHIYLTESNIMFVYNNRMRKYSLVDGVLVENLARRYGNGYSYEGVDRKEEFIK